MSGAGLRVTSRLPFHFPRNMTAHAPFDTVIFDLDGTVSDSAPGILASLDHAFNETGYPPPDDLVRFIGPPFETAFRAEGFTPDEITILMASYRAHYWDIGAFVNTVYPGIEDVLDTLATDGFRLAIATSKPEPTARRILEYFQYTTRFDVIGGATFDTTRATKSAVLSYVLDHLGESRPVMVGDRYHDVEGAAEHGIDCVGVRWGYSAGDELQRAGARWIIDKPREIIDIVRGVVAL
jgi:phosphoglycolate phosphatase